MVVEVFFGVKRQFYIATTSAHLRYTKPWIHKQNFITRFGSCCKFVTVNFFALVLCFVGRSLVEPTFMLTSGGGSEGFSAAPRYPKIQGSRPVTFWYVRIRFLRSVVSTLNYGSGSCSFLQWLSSFQPQKHFFQTALAYYILCVHLHQSSKIRSL